jgi:hypothetical protein
MATTSRNRYAHTHTRTRTHKLNRSIHFIDSHRSNVYLSIYLSIYSCCSHLEHRASAKRFVSPQFLNHKTVGMNPWTGDQPDARPLPTTNTEKTQTNIHALSGIRTPAFERAKTVHALDRAATAIGSVATTACKTLAPETKYMRTD